MADNQEKSDDLIAELAKLMASSAQGSETETKPSVIKLTPLSEANTPVPPVRIPGMDTGSVTPMVPTAGLVRIPGLDPSNARPAPEPEQAAEPAEDVPAAESRTPDTAAENDAPAPIFAEADGDEEVTPQAPAVESPIAATTPTPSTGLPDLGFNPAPEATEAPPRDVASHEPFNFDFGFGAPATPVAAEMPPVPAPEMADAPPAEHDPIADLITAELDVPAPPEPYESDVAPADHRSMLSGDPAPIEPHGTLGRANVVATPAQAGDAAPAVDQPSQRPEGSDRFSAAPVFGVGTTPTPAPSPVRSDPMDEIESLIGDAVRVQLSGTEGYERPAPESQPTAPVVPPLNTGFAPRRVDLKDLDRASMSAEQAILAAAAATGVEVGRIEAPQTDERPYKRAAINPPNTSRLLGPMRQYVGMGVAALLLLAAGFGLYSVLGMGGTDPESAPVLTADTSPVKEAPAATPADTAEAPRSVVFDEIDGVDTADGGETLVSRDQTAGSSATEVARVATPETTDAGSESALANRKVRTVTVRPDGTIVSADDAVAGTEALPVERPNVPELPGAVQPSDLLTAAAASESATASSAAATATTDDPIASIVARTEETGATAAAAPTELASLATEAGEPDAPVVFDGGLTPPVPMPRPVDRSALNNGSPRSAATSSSTPQNSARAPASIPLVSVTQEAAASSAPAPTPTTTPAAAGNNAAYVQLASLPTEADARSQSAAMQSRWGNLLGGQSLVVQRAELGNGRVTYRVRLPASSLQGANQICASIKANGGDCFAANS